MQRCTYPHLTRPSGIDAPECRRPATVSCVLTYDQGTQVFLCDEHFEAAGRRVIDRGAIPIK